MNAKLLWYFNDFLPDSVESRLQVRSTLQTQRRFNETGGRRRADTPQYVFLLRFSFTLK